MRVLGSWLRHALLPSYTRFSLPSMEAVAPRVVRLEASAQGEAAWKRFATAVPGQFVFLRLRAPGLAQDPPSGFRPLSIAGIDKGERRLSFLVKGSGAWSLSLVDALPGFPKELKRSSAGRVAKDPGGGRDACGARPWSVDLDGPYGRFTLRDATPRGCEAGPLVFIAGGIGIAPFLAMAEEVARADAKRRLLILWSAGTREDLAGLDGLIGLAKASPAIRTVPILAHDPLWEGRKGHIDEAALSDLAGAELTDPAASFWLCAPAGLRARLLKSLKAAGVPRRRIRVENFRL
jgi:ferredoxin-NADP reductase